VELEAVFLNSSQDGAARPEIVGRLQPKRSRAAAPPGGLIDGERLIGESPAMEEIKAAIQRVAATDTNVLITGETGTGKELIAELIQKNSKRRQNRYVCINCAAIPDSLVESELFGYERGAFTGAQIAGEGKLEGANGGTVFFDEIGDMSMYAQAKILRLIETKEIQRLGSRRLTRLDFRVIAATNQDIDSPASSARFRRDLYFRLNVARIHVPALRERKADIPLLIRHFIHRFNGEFGRRVEGVGEETMRDLLRYEWPGNIRELKNTMEAMFVNLPTGGEARLDLPDRLRRHISGAAGLPPTEQERLLSALWATDWNKSKSAKQLHWSRMTLYRKMMKYGLEPKPPRSPLLGQARVANNSRS
jgi:DNA-binding NtrC family response regulator